MGKTEEICLDTEEIYQEGVIQFSTHFLALFSDQIKNTRSVDSHVGNEFTFNGLFLINTKNKPCPGCSSRFTFLTYFHFQKNMSMCTVFSLPTCKCFAQITFETSS